MNQSRSYNRENYAISANKAENISVMIVLYLWMMIVPRFHTFSCPSKLLCKYKITYYHNSLRHPKEKISKSSIIPSKIIAPESVEIKHDLEIE